MKSRATGFLPFAETLLVSVTRKCHTSKVDFRRDLKTLRKRFEHEGMSFLTITLPAFAGAFDRALAIGKVDLSDFSGWKSQKCLPAFMRGFTCRVFESTTGGLLDEPSISCIEAVRQFCLCFKKIKLPCTRSREQKAIDGYVEVERFLQTFMPDQSEFEAFGKVSDLLWANLFVDFDHHQVCPRHGPGAVVEHYTQNSKYSNRRWSSRLEPFFPADEFAFCNISHFLDEGDELIEVETDQELPVKVTLVPKTLKAPRIIAIEPCCMQFAQQGLARYLVSSLKANWITSGHINFDDQTINQSLAMSASQTCQLATIDMSEASDRISLSVVQRMLKHAPDLLGALEACRSKAAKLPSGEIIHLSKFASMGSAVCFPIEAMVFFTIIISSILKQQALPVTLRNIYKVSRKVYVYGDDIILPTNMVDAAFKSLCSLGNKVNSRKSFYQGHFRESCGIDAYNGNLVTPTYVRSRMPESRADVSELVSMVATANQFYLKGLYEPLLYLRQVVEGLLGPLPSVQDTCSGLGWLHPFDFPRSLRRVYRKYQVEQVLTWVPAPVYRIDRLDGWSALFKFFIRSNCTPAYRLSRPEGIDKDHLKRTPRYGTASMKRRWVTPY